MLQLKDCSKCFCAQITYTAKMIMNILMQVSILNSELFLVKVNTRSNHLYLSAFRKDISNFKKINERSQDLNQNENQKTLKSTQIKLRCLQSAVQRCNKNNLLFLPVQIHFQMRFFQMTIQSIKSKTKSNIFQWSTKMIPQFKFLNQITVFLVLQVLT